MFREADQDGDGAISHLEFEKLLLGNDTRHQVFGRFHGEKKAGETRHLRNAGLPEGGELLDNFRGHTNLKEIFETNVKSNPDKPFLGQRAKVVGADGTVTFGDYQWRTYAQVHEESRAVAAFLMKHDLCPKITNEEGVFRFIALYSKNRDEWVVADFGAMVAAVTCVTLYDTLGQESIEYILDQTSMRTVVLSADKIKNITDLKAAGKIPTTTTLIHFDQANPADVERAQANGLTVYSFTDVIA
jgi:long-chain acyl-CoA synthetase